MARKCGQCGSEKTCVIDSGYNHQSDTVRRRRECPVCGYRYTTHERVEMLGQEVVKRSGAIEPFDEQKIIRSLELACSRLPVLCEIINIAGAVARTCFEKSKVRVTSEELRDEVKRRLLVLEPAAYVRYRLGECQGPCDIMTVLAQVMKGGP